MKIVFKSYREWQAIVNIRCYKSHVDAVTMIDTAYLPESDWLAKGKQGEYNLETGEGWLYVQTQQVYVHAPKPLTSKYEVNVRWHDGESKHYEKTVTVAEECIADAISKALVMLGNDVVTVKIEVYKEF